MIQHYFRHFLRNLSRQKLFSTINLLGLTASLVCTILIYLYVSHELSYDKFHAHADRLYRVNQTFIWSENRDEQLSRTGPGVAIAMKEELPEVELVTSLHTPGNFIISYTDPKSKEVISFEEDKILAADTNFFKVLNFPLIKGDMNSAFRHENTLMMTRSTAEKYFGVEEPVGKLVRLSTSQAGETQTFEVIGVIEDVPDNSTIEFNVLLSMKNFPVDQLHWSWVWTQLETFVLFREDADMNNVLKKLQAIPRKRAEETLRRAMGVSYDEYIASGKRWELFLQPVYQMHLPEQAVVGSFPDTGNIKTIYSFIGAAIFIILLSCVNFMNLSTAQFTKRVKEASVRKILGLGRKQLGISYFIEALCFCMIALVVALAITQLTLPLFNYAIGKNLHFSAIMSPRVLLSLLSVILLMAIVSSSYPAFFLGRFNPAEAIKGKIKVGSRGTTFRNGLVIFQFAVSVVLIICTAVVYQQLQFFTEKDLGFDKENLIELQHVEAIQHPESLAKALLNVPGVQNASLCSSTPPKIFGGDTFGAEGFGDQRFSLNFTSVDESYIPTLNIRLKAGRNFSNNPNDIGGVILNEAALTRLGWATDETSLGKKITRDGADFEIIGIASDFNYWSVATSIEPMGIFHIRNTALYPDKRSYIAIRVQPKSLGDWKKTIGDIQKIWQKHAGDTPFEYGFIDDYFADTFKTEQQFGNVLTIMAVLTMLIACLGLLGMIIYSLEQRTKEIGIRKVSGASAWNILTLISTGYTRLILIAFMLGAPLAWWLMDAWLRDFANRISLSPGVFIAAGISIFLVAILITSYHSVKAALTNPVDVLKDE